MKKLLLAVLIAVCFISCSTPNIKEATTLTELPVSLVNKLSDSTLLYNYAVITTIDKIYLVQNKKVMSVVDNNNYDTLFIIIIIILLCLLLAIILLNIDR